MPHDTVPLPTTELSCRALRAMLLYFRNNYGEPRLREAIAHLSLPQGVDLDFMSQEDNWLRFEDAQAVLDALVVASRDADFPRRAGMLAGTREVLGVAYAVLRAVGTPRLCYTRLVAINEQYNRVGRFRIEEMGRRHAVISYHSTKRETSRRFCEFRMAQYASMLQTMNLPPARIVEHECQVDGAPCCRYRLDWVNRAPRLAPLVGLAAGAGAGLAVGAWLGVPPAATGAAGMTMAGALIGALSGALVAQRRQLRERDRHVQEANDDVLKVGMRLQERFREVQQLNRNLLVVRSAAIFGLAKLAESRDENTGQHLERMRELTVALARRLAEHPAWRGYITAEYLEDIYQSAILHDIGKVGVPDEVLLKPGRLTPSEFEIIKRHPLIGAAALSQMQAQVTFRSFLTLGIQIARSHHEWWDGRGYPDGLVGEAIPLSARIVAVADVYDALTSRRPYKEPLPEAKALEIMQQERGHFDQRILDAFLAGRPAPC